MLNEDNARKVLNELCRKGKRISIVIEVVDTEKALDLMSSMHTGKEQSGVVVQSWGAFDIIGAHENQVKAIEELNREYQENMERLTNPNNLRDFAEQN